MSTLQADTSSQAAGSEEPEGMRRRSFLGTAAAATGSLVVGFHVPLTAHAQAQGQAAAEVNAWVVVQPDERVIVRIARSEMGQGTLTGLAQLVAEELECDWARVTTEYPYPRPEPGAQPRLGRLLHGRQPRHPRVAGPVTRCAAMAAANDARMAAGAS